MKTIEDRYQEARADLSTRMMLGISAARIDPEGEARVVAGRFHVARKRRSAAEYQDVAEHLLQHYTPEVAYAIAIEINEQFETHLGYPPIGQIMVALEAAGSERA